MTTLKTKNRPGDDQEADTPLINGRPALTVEIVQKWFSDMIGKQTSPDDAAAIAQAINYLDLFKSEWRDEDAFKKERKNNPSTKRLKAIRTALEVLSVELPVAIEESKRPLSQKQQEIELAPFIDFLSKTNYILSAFKNKATKGRGRYPKNWHKVARNLVPIVKGAMKSAGAPRGGFGAPTGQGVQILKLALSRLEINVKDTINNTAEDMIIEAIRPNRKRPQRANSGK